MLVDLPAPHGRLEGLLEPVPQPLAAAVVCHPHPLLGGSMQAHVPYRLARALRALGASTLRFNFRGVGRSTGRHDAGEGEREDLTAALDFLAEQSPGLPLWVAGYSFGAWVGLRQGGAEPRVAALLGVGLPLSMFDFGFLGQLAQPVALIQAEHDAFGTAAQLRALLVPAAGPRQLEEIPAADHLFEGQLDSLEQAVAACGPLLSSGS